MTNKPIIAITMGEASGIGPEILAKLFSKKELFEFCKPLAIGDLRVMQRARDLYANSLSLNIIDDPSEGQYQYGYIDLIDLNDLPDGSFEDGVPNGTTGRDMLNTTRKAVSLFMEGKVQGTVGCPHSKYAAELAGEHFDGYPGLIANMTNSKHPYLMLSNGKLCVSNVTLHVSFRKALDMLSVDLVYNCIIETNKAMKYFGIESPRIAVSGLNPHAGENRLFGDEDVDIILPAINKAKEEGLNVSGPFPADSLFNNCLTNNRFDSYIAMYHDQAHLPVKVLVFDESSAVAIGVPVNWATVDHGCALDIAWQGKANPNALFRTTKLIASRAPYFSNEDK